MNSEIEKLIGYLNSLKLDADGNMNVYVAKFEDIRKKFNECETIRAIWNDFDKSLTHYKDGVEERMYSIVAASEYFSFQNFTQGMNMTFWQGYGGTFTGLGILGTFAGLTVGLSGIDMTSSDIEILKSGIAKLLSGVQFAFYTSLIGIIIAIIYGILHNRSVNNFRKNIQQFAGLIEEMFPRRTAEEWLAKNYLQSSEQTTALKNIGTDVGQIIVQNMDSIISRLCDQIEDKITPLFENVCNSINKLGDGGTNAINETMSKLAGSQMQGFADSLNNFTDSIQKTVSDSQKTGETMNRIIMTTLEEMRSAIKAGAEDVANHQRESVKENSIAIESLIENMHNFTEQQQQMLEQFAKNNTSQIQLATKIFQSSVSNHLQQTLSDSKQVTEEMNKNFLSTLDEMLKILKTGSDDVANRQRKSIEENVETINSLTDNMKIFAERQEQILTKSVAESANQIESANNLFRSTLSKHNESMEKSYRQMETFMGNTENVLLRIKTATASLGQTAIPLQQSITLLKECLKDNEAAAERFRYEISAQIDKLAKSNQKSKDSIENLVEGLQEYEKNIERAWLEYKNNFDRIGGEIEKATNIITERLNNYNNMMNNGMKETLQDFDNSVSNAVGLLQSAVEELQESVDSFTKKV